MIPKLLLILFLIPRISEATDFKPWFGNQYEVEIRASVLYQKYDKVAVPHHDSFHYRSNDAFVTLSAAYPFMKYCGEFEAKTAFTHAQNGRWDEFRVTGRYQLLNELEGFPLTLVAGITLDEPYVRALHDISSFHHGHLEGEFFFSWGKKYGYPCLNNFDFRWWNVLGFGCAEIGSPWIRGDAAGEIAFGERHLVRLFVHTLFGMGRRDLEQHHFHGYGSIKHKSVDVGLRYTYATECSGSFILQYARRVFAYNFPKEVNLVLIEYYYPFGTQPTSRY